MLKNSILVKTAKIRGIQNVQENRERRLQGFLLQSFFSQFSVNEFFNSHANLQQLNAKSIILFLAQCELQLPTEAAMGMMGKLVRYAVTLLAAAALAQVAPLFSQDAANEAKSSAAGPAILTECRFSDGGTIAIGRKASGPADVGANSWRAGDYEATTFRVSEHMVIPPLESPIEIPVGSYTLFVKDEGEPPWTLIVSKKTGEWGMPYPGEQYDLGRTSFAVRMCCRR